MFWTKTLVSLVLVSSLSTVSYTIAVPASSPRDTHLSAARVARAFPKKDPPSFNPLRPNPDTSDPDDNPFAPLDPFTIKKSTRTAATASNADSTVAAGATRSSDSGSATTTDPTSVTAAPTPIPIVVIGPGGETITTTSTITTASNTTPAPSSCLYRVMLRNCSETTSVDGTPSPESTSVADSGENESPTSNSEVSEALTQIDTWLQYLQSLFKNSI